MGYRIMVMLTAGVLAFAHGLVPAHAAEEKGASGKKIKWVTSLDKAFAEAKKQKKVLMVDFYATWCPPCKILDAQVFPNPEVVKLAAKSLVCAKIDVERDRVGQAKHGIQAMPTILFFDPNGQMIARFEGADKFIPAERAVETMGGVIKDYRDLPDLEKKIKANPNDPDVALRLATIYTNRQKLVDAEKLLAVVERVDNGKDPKSDEAVAKRRKALESAYRDVTFLRVALVNTLLQRNQIERAAKEMNMLLASKHAPPDVKAQVRQILKQIKELAEEK